MFKLIGWILALVVLFWFMKYVEIDTERLYNDTIELIKETKSELTEEVKDD